MGLRPGEVTSLYPDDFTLPECIAGGSGEIRAVIALGTRKGTKAKCVQSVVCRNPVIIGVLRWMCRTCKANSTLMGISYDGYRKLLRSVQAQAGLDAGYTPHSSWAGYATESIAEGKDFVSVREGGRWLSDSSLRIYLDLVGAASLAQQHKLQGREFELVHAAKHFLEFLPGALDFQRAEDHNGIHVDPFVVFKDWNASRPGRVLVPGVGPKPWADPRRESDQETRTRRDSASDSDCSGQDLPRVSFEPARAGDDQSNDRHASRGRGRGSQGSGGSKGRGRGHPSSAGAGRR